MLQLRRQTFVWLRRPRQDPIRLMPPLKYTRRLPRWLHIRQSATQGTNAETEQKNQVIYLIYFHSNNNKQYLEATLDANRFQREALLCENNLLEFSVYAGMGIRKIYSEYFIYDTLNLIGVVGGSLGLFVGFSFYDFIITMIENVLNKVNV